MHTFWAVFCCCSTSWSVCTPGLLYLDILYPIIEYAAAITSIGMKYITTTCTHVGNNNRHYIKWTTHKLVRSLLYIYFTIICFLYCYQCSIIIFLKWNYWTIPIYRQYIKGGELCMTGPVYYGGNRVVESIRSYGTMETDRVPAQYPDSLEPSASSAVTGNNWFVADSRATDKATQLLICTSYLKTKPATLSILQSIAACASLQTLNTIPVQSMLNRSATAITSLPVQSSRCVDVDSWLAYLYRVVDTSMWIVD